MLQTDRTPTGANETVTIVKFIWEKTQHFVMQRVTDILAARSAARILPYRAAVRLFHIGLFIKDSYFLQQCGLNWAKPRVSRF